MGGMKDECTGNKRDKKLNWGSQEERQIERLLERIKRQRNQVR